MSEVEFVCGVERDVLEKFLTLIRDKFPAAVEAGFFLETVVGVSNISEMSNLRDVLSHLVTLLRQECPKENDAQYANAEEHLRRATMEPYQRAVSHIGVQVMKMYEEYRTYVIPIIDKDIVFSSCPNLVSIEARLGRVREMRMDGRRSKGENTWNAQWEVGVQNLIQAFRELESLRFDLEGGLSKYFNLRRERKTRMYFWWGVIVTAILGISGIIISIRT